MRMKALKRFIVLITFIFAVESNMFIFAKDVKGQEYINKTLITLKIIEDSSNMNEPVTRAEFAKMIVRASEYREKTSDNISEVVCNDVGINAPYAAYIKKALDAGYMYTYLGGFFKPYDYVKYEDLSRACLALLSYNNDDFRSNQVQGRNLKFESLELNRNIDKKDKETLYKIDIVNGIYNTLNEKIKDSNTIYAESIFEKIIIDADKEINASEYVESKTDGPFFVKKENDLNIPFEITKHNVYINGKQCTIEELKDDIVNYGYAIYYLDIDKKMLYAYTERQDISAPIMLRRGYVYRIHYSASNMTVPYRVDIDNYKYMLDSEQVKFDFSASGCFKVDDEIVYLCNKMNDVNSSYRDSKGKRIYDDGETEPYNGSIVVAFSASLIKEE